MHVSGTHHVDAATVEYGKAYGRGWGDITTTDFTDVVGRPARSFAEFAHDHAAFLRAAHTKESPRSSLAGGLLIAQVNTDEGSELAEQYTVIRHGGCLAGNQF